jgi:hypothetical protein
VPSSDILLINGKHLPYARHYANPDGGHKGEADVVLNLNSRSVFSLQLDFGTEMDFPNGYSGS